MPDESVSSESNEGVSANPSRGQDVLAAQVTLEALSIIREAMKMTMYIANQAGGLESIERFIDTDTQQNSGFRRQ